MSDEYGPEFPDPHGKRAALREAERIMASVQQAKKRKSQAKKAKAEPLRSIKRDPKQKPLFPDELAPLKDHEAELVAAESYPGRFPEAVKAAHHRMGANGKGAEPGTGGGSG